MHSTYVAFLIVAFTVFAFSEAVQNSRPHFIVKNRYNYNNLFVDDIPIDQPCDKATDTCVGPIGSSECTDEGLCTCTPDFIKKSDNSNCLARIGKPCDEDNGIICAEPSDRSFCNDEDSTDMKCECKEDFHPRPDLGTCLAKLGVPCNTNDDCVESASLTECDKTCKCTGQYHIPKQDNTTCVVRIGGPCTEAEECAGQKEDSASVDCTSNQCQCTTGHVRGGAQQWSKCLRIRNQLEDPCEESVQCRAGDPGQFSVCIESDPENGQMDKKCRCTRDAVHEVDQNVCYKKPSFIGGPEGSCQIQAQCEPLKAKCTGDIDNPGMCQCDADHVPNSGNDLCLERRQLGEMCQEKPQCTNDAICTPTDADGNPIDEDPDDPKPKFCICDKKNDFIEDGEKCLKLATKLGENCTIEAQCTTKMQNSECNDETKTCKCPETGFVANGANNKCLEIRTEVDKEDELCEENVQCVSPPDVDDRRECVGTPSGESKTCKCLTGQYINPPSLPGRCYKIVRDINQGCEHPIQCTTTMGDLSDCMDYKCQCKLSQYQFYNETGKCYIPSRLGQRCDETEECIVGVNKNAYCTSTLDGRCACLPGKIIEYNGKCYEEKMIGNPCETDEECNASIKGGQAQCDRDSKTCECKSGFKGDASGILCAPSGAANLNPSNVLVLVLTLAFAYAVGFRQ